jgi:predicted aspartyl protease
MRGLMLALALIGLAGCATTAEVSTAKTACALVRLGDMPIETRDNMLFVRATIGDVPLTLLVDTGAERTLLTEATVERLHLPRDLHHATRTYGIGVPTASWDAKLPDGLTLGDAHLPVDTVTVGRFEMPAIGGGSADGLLGADTLLAFDVDLDLPAQKLTLYRTRVGCPDASPPWPKPYVDLAGITTKDRRLLIPFELDGFHGLGVLDTGAQLSSINQTMAARTGVVEDVLATDRVVMAHGAAPEQTPVRMHRFREFRVGAAVERGAMMPVVPMSSGMGDALVGADFLQGRRVWLSFSTQRVFMTPIEHGPWIATAQTAPTSP